MATEERMIDANDVMKNTLSLEGILAVPVYCIENAPTVKLVHGRWLNSPTVAFTEECSACGFCVPWDRDGWLHEYNYCPNCGADMRERKDNDL